MNFRLSKFSKKKLSIGELYLFIMQ